jgi:hypothetical protein
MTDRPDLVAECGLDRAPGATARGVLEELISPALERPPCVIGFSGGRDSSSLLALATHLARREGLPMPVAGPAHVVETGKASLVRACRFDKLVANRLFPPSCERSDMGPGNLHSMDARQN